MRCTTPLPLRDPAAPALRGCGSYRQRVAAFAAVLCCAGCSSPSEESAPKEAVAAGPTASQGELESEEDAPRVDPCVEAVDAHTGNLRELVETHGACEFDNGCVVVTTHEEGCYHGCPIVLHARGVGAARRQTTAQLGCVAGCTAGAHDCAEGGTPKCIQGQCTLTRADGAELARLAIPAGNRPGTEPPRPPPGGVEQERAARLFEAIQHDDPARALDFFFPKEAFHITKAIADPDAYWERLFRRYQQDIHALHEQLRETLGEERLAAATFDRLDIIRRGGWVPVREEGNALPYWVSRHSMLHYRTGEQTKRFEVRVLITWDERWYITHLNEFH